MKKGWLIGCGIAGVLGIGLACAGLIFVFVYGVFSLTKPVVDASEEFLDLLGQGKVAEAYAATASGFRAKQDEASFTAAARQLGLTDYASVSWHNRQIVNQEGRVEGNVTTKDGKTTPVAIRLVKEGGAWKVVAVRYGGVEITDIQKAPSPKVPADAELKRMATEALLDLNEAVKAKDFTAFHRKVSTTWQKQTTPDELKKGFQEFVDKEVDIAGIKEVEPRFDLVPAIDDQGVLLVSGHYPTRPSQVRFTLKYVQEAAGWKLLSIRVNVGE